MKFFGSGPEAGGSGLHIADPIRHVNIFIPIIDPIPIENNHGTNKIYRFVGVLLVVESISWTADHCTM